MKKLVSLAVIFFAAALFWVCDASAKTVRVTKAQGGTLGHIAVGCGHTVTHWSSLSLINPQLPLAVEIEPGVWDVRVHEGDPVVVPDDWDCSKLDPQLGKVETEPASKEAKAGEGTVKPTPNIGAGDAGSGQLLWFLNPMVWALILLILVALVFLANIAVPLIRRRDPSRYPARIPGGLSSDMDTAIRQLGIAYPGRRYERIERGRLVRESGPHRILVRRMDFGDGISRDAYLNPGDQVYRGTRPGGGYDYFLRSCGNLGPEFELPAGWRVVVLLSQDVDRPAPAPTASATASTPTPPVPPIPPIPPAPPVPPAPVFPDEPEPAPAPVPAPAPKPITEPEPSVAAAEVEETAEEIPTSNEVEITIGDLLIRVATGNGHIPATKIRTGDGVEVTLQQP